MGPVFKVLLVVWASLWLGHNAFSQTLSKKEFEAKMYSIEAISHFGLYPEKFASLSDSNKQNLLASRDDLMSLLRAIEQKRDALAFVTHDLAQKYHSSTELAASLVEQETSILAAGVTDFDLIDGGAIRLHFFAVISSEGTLTVSEKSAILKKSDSGWRVARFQ